MTPSGDFRETPFAELVRRCARSRESAAVTVRLGGPAASPDGLFRFVKGQLVEASLAGAEGREALRRALRLEEGAFSVAAFGQVPERMPPDGWTRMVEEELALAERERAARAARAAPPAQRRRRNVALLALLALGGASILTIGTIVLLLLSPAAQRANDVVQEVLDLPPQRGRGVAGDELRLGIVAPFSGANRELGQGMKAGLLAAFGEANAAGGVHGRRLQLLAADDGYEPSRTGPALRELVERGGVFALVGNVGTPTAAVALPYCARREVLLFGALSGGDLLRRSPPDRLVFNFRPSYADETAAAVRWLVGARGIDPRRIAVFAQEDEFGAAGWRGVARALERSGVAPSGVLRVGYRRNGADVSAAVAAVRARAGAVDAVVMIATYRAAAAFIRAAREAGLSLRYTNVSAVDPGALALDLASSRPAARDEVLVTHVVPPLGTGAPVERRYREALARHVPGERPGSISLEGFVVGSLLVEGLRRAGRSLDTPGLVAALEGMGELDLGLGARVGFAPGDHDASREVWGSLLQPDGSQLPVDMAERRPATTGRQQARSNSAPR